MPKTFTDTGLASPLLDIASYARRGPGQRDRLSTEEIQLITRTVRRTPEVMVKVLSRGGQDMKSVGKHFAYLSRKGDLEIETDDGRHIEGRGAEADLLEDWDLDIQEQRPTSSLGTGISRTVPKLVHKVLFSMPPGTPPKKVLEAVKVFAREEFGAKHRYAMVLHTDEPHPHVHMVVKAVSEDGARLNIRKSTLRDWRRQFARRLREEGIEANATERAVRFSTTAPISDGLYRVLMRSAALSPSLDRRPGAMSSHPPAAANSKSTPQHRTLESVVLGWRAAGRALSIAGDTEIQRDIDRFLANVPSFTAKQEPSGERSV
jgi:hypothetical protein